MTCPNCGSPNHIHCTRRSDVDAIERKVTNGMAVPDAAIEHAAESMAGAVDQPDGAGAEPTEQPTQTCGFTFADGDGNVIECNAPVTSEWSITVMGTPVLGPIRLCVDHHNMLSQPGAIKVEGKFLNRVIPAGAMQSGYSNGGVKR